MARAWSTPRTVCNGCGDPLTFADMGRDYCLVCRRTKDRGVEAWDKRMRMSGRKRRSLGDPPDDPFQGFREGDD